MDALNLVFQYRINIINIRHFAFFETIIQNKVLKTVKENTVRLFAVSTSSPYLLIVAFHGGGQVEMDNKPHIGLIDAHTERYCRHYNHRVVV
jgi:hypothetical protein